MHVGVQPLALVSMGILTMMVSSTHQELLLGSNGNAAVPASPDVVMQAVLSDLSCCRVSSAP